MRYGAVKGMRLKSYWRCNGTYKSLPQRTYKAIRRSKEPGPSLKLKGRASFRVNQARSLFLREQEAWCENFSDGDAVLSGPRWRLDVCFCTGEVRRKLK